MASPRVAAPLKRSLIEYLTSPKCITEYRPLGNPPFLIETSANLGFNQLHKPTNGDSKILRSNFQNIFASLRKIIRLKRAPRLLYIFVFHFRPQNYWTDFHIILRKCLTIEQHSNLQTVGRVCIHKNVILTSIIFILIMSY